MKQYRDMTPLERARVDYESFITQELVKYFAEQQMDNYDSLPKWQRDEIKETNDVW